MLYKSNTHDIATWSMTVRWFMIWKPKNDGCELQKLRTQPFQSRFPHISTNTTICIVLYASRLIDMQANHQTIPFTLRYLSLKIPLIHALFSTNSLPHNPV